MTKVNVYFGSPEPYHGLELDAQSQVAYDAWQNCDEAEAQEYHDAFLEEFERQVRPLMGSRGYIEDLDVEVADEALD